MRIFLWPFIFIALLSYETEALQQETHEPNSATNSSITTSFKSMAINLSLMLPSQSKFGPPFSPLFLLPFALYSALSFIYREKGTNELCTVARIEREKEDNSCFLVFLSTVLLEREKFAKCECVNKLGLWSNWVSWDL